MLNERRTEGDAERSTRGDQVILELVVQGSKDKDEHMEEAPDEEEHPPAPFIDHPECPLLAEGTRLVRLDLVVCVRGVRPLQPLEPPALRHVALQVARLVASQGDIIHVRVLLQRRHLTIGKVEAGRTLLGIVVRHCCPNIAECCTDGRRPVLQGQWRGPARK